MRFAAAFLFLTFLPALLYAQQRATIVGRVVEFGGRAGVVGATVASEGLPQMITRADGRFTFENVSRGPRVFTITAPGYHARQLALNVQRDTVVTVELEPQPFQLESLTVQARTVTVRGRLGDQATGAPVYDGEVTFGGNRTAYSNLNGSFKVTRVPMSAPVILEVRAVGYLPLEMSFHAERDTTLWISLTSDPLATRMLAEELRRLQVRSNSLGYAQVVWNRAELARYRTITVAELLRTRYRVTDPACVFLDDGDRSAYGKDVIDNYFVDEFERIEVIDRDTMVRLYTRRYISKLVGRAKLPPAMLVKAYKIACM